MSLEMSKVFSARFICINPSNDTLSIYIEAFSYISYSVATSKFQHKVRFFFKIKYHISSKYK